ncbi:MAG TPA: hypothetical protein VFA48_11115 [Gammaproteobacteria bacterium]|nr:hypothetical protein [Gammaproteobacteria bacterium]
MQPVQFSASPFVPIALGFFGLGTGYLIFGPQELFGWPSRDEKIDFANGVWGIWMPGFCQFMAGTYLFIGLSWFHVFKGAPLYMAALAFSVYGIHWFAMGWNRMRQADARPNGFMAIAFLLVSILGLMVFWIAGDWPVALIFAGLIAVYIFDIFASLKLFTPASERLLGLSHLITGLWLMYMTFATGLDLANGLHLPL